MNKPPDLPSLKWDKSKTHNFSQLGPIYLLMSRIKSKETLSNVSPFLIKKAIDYTCNGEVEECKKLMSGSLLIKTKNYVQANKLTTLTALSSSIEVEVTEFKTLNQTKGVIYSNDLRGIPESEITNELLDQNVREVKKINKFVNQIPTETGLTILTFSSSTLPTDIKIGYELVNVRPFIPLPMKCNNCQQFGHTAKFCKNSKICFQCANDYHMTSDNEECKNETNCVNCIHNKIDNTKHSSKDKKCPIFIKHKELQAIKTLNKVDNKTAHKIYNERHHHDGSLYASVANINNQIMSQNKNISTSSNQSSAVPTFIKPSSSTQPRKLINYESITDSDAELLSPTASTSTIGTKLKVLPRKTSKRLQAKLKANEKAIIATTKEKLTKQKNLSVTNGEGQMDYLSSNDL